MSLHLSTKGLLGVALESTRGTAHAPDASEVVMAEDVSFNTTIANRERNPMRTSMSPVDHVLGSQSGTMSFKVEVKSAGDAGDIAPSLSALLQICGFSEAASVGVSHTYAPLDDTWVNGTCDFYLDESMIRMAGCAGNVRFVGQSGDRLMAEFSITGKLPASFLTDDEVETLTSISWESTLPPVMMGSNILTLDFGTPANPGIHSYEFDTGNDVQLIQNANDATGFSYAQIVSRKPRVKIDPEWLENATFASTYHGLWQAGTTADLALVMGATAGNIVTFNHNQAQLMDVQRGSRNGIDVANMEFEPKASDMDTSDESQIVFT